MTDTAQADGVTIARRLVESRFPDARAAWLGGSVAKRANGNSSVQVLAASVDDPGIAELLAFAVGEGDERLNQAVQRYRDDPTLRILVASTEQHPVAILGYALTDTEAIVLHIATALPVRRTGIGTNLLNALRGLVPPGSSIVAETDAEAVGFYRSNGFGVASLGEKYPGVERFRVTLDPPLTTGPSCGGTAK